MSVGEPERSLAETPPLCVDVDCTLLHTDLLFESLLCAVRKNLWLLPVIPLWMIRGKAYLKQQLARRRKRTL